VLGDRGLLERLAGNLVENAVRHNVDGGWLRVDTATVGGRARLAVESSGPVVPPEEVDALFEPFRRHGTARTARTGAGLGLGHRARRRRGARRHRDGRGPAERRADRHGGPARAAPDRARRD
jgi:signal transduction histidine kinase